MIPEELTDEELRRTKAAVDAGINIAYQSHIDEWHSRELTTVRISVPKDILKVAEATSLPVATTSIILKELILLGISKLMDDVKRTQDKEKYFLENYTHDTQH